MRSHRLCIFICLLIAVISLSSTPSIQAKAYDYIELFDLSGSISSTELDNAKGPAKLFVDLSPNGSDGRIKSFPPVPTNVTAWTSNKTTLKNAIDGLTPGSSNTPLYDAIIEACNDLGTHTPPLTSKKGRTLICWTDNGENGSSSTAADVVVAATSNAVTPYIIQYVETPSGADAATPGAIDSMISIIDQLGGKIYIVSDTAEMSAAVKDILMLSQVPSLTNYGLILLLALLLLSGIIVIRRRKALAHH